VLSFSSTRNHYTTPPIQRISPKVQGSISVYEAGNQWFPAPLLCVYVIWDWDWEIMVVNNKIDFVY
jgi:hypothetical protein